MPTPPAEETPSRSRLRVFWDYAQWPLVVVVGVVAFGLGFDGFQQHFERVGDPQPGSRLVYLALQLFTLESGAIEPPVNLELNVARFLAAAVAVYVAARALAAIFRDQGQVFLARTSRNHVVVCGLGRAGVLAARAFKERGDHVVAIERDVESHAIPECRERKIRVVKGDATDRSLLAKAAVARAKHLVVVCGDDGVNAEVAITARGLVRDRGWPLTCSVNIVDFELRDLLEESALAGGGDDSFVPDFFNAAERGAPELLDQHPPFDDEGWSPSGRPPHLVVVGLGEMGASLIVHAALRWRRLHRADRLPVTAVDLEADSRLELLGRRYPRLARVCDVVPKAEDVHSPEFQAGVFLDDRPAVTSAYVCLDDDARGLGAALTLRRLPALRGVVVVVRMTELAQLARLIGREGIGRYENLDAFGVLDRVCTPEVLLGGRRELLARALHEAHVRGQPKAGYKPADDPSLADWASLEERYKDSNRRHAEQIGAHLRRRGYEIVRLTDWDAVPEPFSEEEIEEMAIEEHERWRKQPASDGRANPRRVPWDELDETVRQLNKDTVRSYPEVLMGIGYTIVRAGEPRQ
jgi:hypothetical protein